MKRIFILMLLLCSCASGEKKEGKLIKSFYLPTLHSRRVAWAPANPMAIEGEKGYRSEKSPDAKWDCVPFDDLLKAINWKELGPCLHVLNEGFKANPEPKAPLVFPTLRYYFKRDPAPQLELQIADPAKDPEKAMEMSGPRECIKKVLPLMLVPREIVFQAAEDPKDPVTCYTSKLNIEREDFIVWEKNRAELVIKFPFMSLPDSEDELRALVKSWALAPLWENGLKQDILAKPFPSTMCRACMGEKNMIKDIDPRPTVWP